jgi:hypothetical protein
LLLNTIARFSLTAEITFQGSKACERVREQLLYKLRQKSLAVKIKTLLVLKHLLEQGHPHFQTLLQQYADEIKPCLELRGPPDPLRGDAPYRLVRDKAQVRTFPALNPL